MPSEPVYDPAGRENVLAQERYWWDKFGWRHPICRMEARYIINVLDHLEANASAYATMHALSESRDGGVPDETQHWLNELEDQLPWMRGTPVYRALEAALEGPPPAS